MQIKNDRPVRVGAGSLPPQTTTSQPVGGTVGGSMSAWSGKDQGITSSSTDRRTDPKLAKDPVKTSAGGTPHGTGAPLPAGTIKRGVQPKSDPVADIKNGKYGEAAQQELLRIEKLPGFKAACPALLQRVVQATQEKGLSMRDQAAVFAGKAPAGDPKARDKRVANALKDAGTLFQATHALAPNDPNVQSRILSLCQEPGAEGLRERVAAGNGQLLLQKDSQGTLLVDNLKKIACDPLAPGLSHANLLRSTVDDCFSPTSIRQHGNTCGAAAAAFALAKSSPSEYARLVAGLGSPAGTVKTVSGAELSREDGSIGNSKYGSKTAAALLHPALMEVGNGALQSYSTKNGGGNSILGIPVPDGLSTQGIDRLMEATTGKGHSRHTSDVWHRLVNTVGSGGRGAAPTVVGLALKDGGHAVSVLRVENGKVIFFDSSGAAGGTPRADGLSEMPEAAFKRLLHSVIAAS